MWSARSEPSIHPSDQPTDRPTLRLICRNDDDADIPSRVTEWRRRNAIFYPNLVRVAQRNKKNPHKAEEEDCKTERVEYTLLYVICTLLPAKGEKQQQQQQQQQFLYVDCGVLVRVCVCDRVCISIYTYIPCEAVWGWSVSADEYGARINAASEDENVMLCVVDGYPKFEI